MTGLNELKHMVVSAVTKDELHKHRCPSGHVWEHSNECDGMPDAHHCPRCGQLPAGSHDGLCPQYLGKAEPLDAPRYCVNPGMRDFLASVPPEMLDTIREKVNKAR